MCSVSDVNTTLATFAAPLLVIIIVRLFLTRRNTLAPAARAPAAERRAAIDPYLQPAGRSAANPPIAAAAVDRWDRRTNTRPFHRPCSVCYAGSVSNFSHCLEHLCHSKVKYTDTLTTVDGKKRKAAKGKQTNGRLCDKLTPSC